MLRTMPTSQNRDMGHPDSWRFGRLLFCFVVFEKLSRFVEVEGVSVDNQLVYAGVIGDAEDALDTMAVLAQGLHDEIDVYHAWKFTAAGFHRDTPQLYEFLSTLKFVRRPAWIGRQRRRYRRGLWTCMLRTTG